MQAVVCVLGPTWPLPRLSAMFADDADFNIFTLAELFAFTCNYEARHGLFSGPQEGGDVLYSRGVGGEPEALWRGPGWAEPGPSAPQGSCLGLCSTRPPPSHPSTCVVLACSVHPRVGRGVGLVEMESGQCFLSPYHVSGTVLVPGLGLQELAFSWWTRTRTH